MRILLFAIFSSFFCGSLFAALSADQVAELLEKNQNPTALCKKFGVFRARGGAQCADKPFGDIAYVICHKHTSDFAGSECGKKVTKDGTREEDQIYVSFANLIENMTDANQKTVCNTLEQSNTGVFERLTACKKSKSAATPSWKSGTPTGPTISPELKTAVETAVAEANTLVAKVKANPFVMPNTEALIKEDLIGSLETILRIKPLDVNRRERLLNEGSQRVRKNLEAITNLSNDIKSQWSKTLEKAVKVLNLLEKLR